MISSNRGITAINLRRSDSPGKLRHVSLLPWIKRKEKLRCVTRTALCVLDVSSVLRPGRAPTSSSRHRGLDAGAYRKITPCYPQTPTLPSPLTRPGGEHPSVERFYCIPRWQRYTSMSVIKRTIVQYHLPS